MKTNKTNAASTTTTKPAAIESLETRQMMSVSATIDASKVLNIHATAGADNLFVAGAGKYMTVYDVNAGKKLPSGVVQPKEIATFDVTGLKGVRLYGDAGNDYLTIGAAPAVPIFVYGGNGHDTLEGSDGQDNLFGGNGMDYLRGNGGVDILYGEADDDTLMGDFGSQHAMDFMSGGTGRDTVSYADSADGVTVNLDGTLTSGVAGEHDCVSADIENVIGSRYADKIWGNNAANLILGGNGNDTIYGMGGDDGLFGESGHDYLSGGKGKDFMVGGAGSDTFYAAGDNELDTIWGGQSGVFTDQTGDVDTAFVDLVGGKQYDFAAGVEKWYAV